MSRVLLIAANRVTTPYPVFPLGPAIIAGALNDSGHVVRQLDLLTDNGTTTTVVKEFRPDYICLSLRNIDNTDSLSGLEGWYLEEARRLVAELKNLCPAPVIIGGPAFSLMPEAILDFIGADFGIVGEGEKSLPGLLRRLNAGERPQKLIRSDQFLAPEDFGRPLVEEKILRHYLTTSGVANLQSKRGCPHGCVYCTYPTLEGRRFRKREAGAVVDDIARLQSDYQVESLFFVDSVFNDRDGHHLEIAAEILRRNLRIKWSAFFRPQQLPAPDLELMQKAGLYALELGSDSLSEAPLQEMGKGFSLEDILAVHRAAMQLKIPVAHYLIFGGPGETTATLQEGIERLDLIDDGVCFLFSGLRLLPGTRLYERALAEALLTPETSLLQPLYYHAPGLDPAAITTALNSACKGRRRRLFPPEEALERLQVMRRFGFNGLLWDQLIRF